MRFIACKGKFVCTLLTIILYGSLFTRVVFADDEPKTVPLGNEQPKKPGTAKTEGVGQSASTGTETSAAQEPKRRALPAPLDPLFPGSDYLGLLHSSAYPTRIPSIKRELTRGRA